MKIGVILKLYKLPFERVYTPIKYVAGNSNTFNQVKSGYKPVSTQSCFQIQMKSITFKERLNDVQITFCVNFSDIPSPLHPLLIVLLCLLCFQHSFISLCQVLRLFCPHKVSEAINVYIIMSLGNVFIYFASIYRCIFV